MLMVYVLCRGRKGTLGHSARERERAAYYTTTMDQWSVGVRTADCHNHFANITTLFHQQPER
jgi:hypothetical protein